LVQLFFFTKKKRCFWAPPDPLYFFSKIHAKKLVKTHIEKFAKINRGKGIGKTQVFLIKK